MALSKIELNQENEYLKKCLIELDNQIESLSSGLVIEVESINEFSKYIWNERGNMDPVEIRSNMLSNEMEARNFERKSNYLKKLIRIKNAPYFGRIDFLSNELYQVYIGITYLTKNNQNLIYDWRSPIASLFYDSESGPAIYQAPEGNIKGELLKKRQYKIENRELIHVFDNNINVTDELLQQILSNNTSEKMKNIVNTIQKEQNEIIRNISDEYLIIQGIAGSGKTSVALHRIAFLLYKIKNLTSNNVLIFSPNNIFSEYISNVLPELGENNAKETTFSDFAYKYITEYKKVETFPEFISRYYSSEEPNKELIRIKQSDLFIEVIENYVKELIQKINYPSDLAYEENTIKKDELNYLLKERYEKVPLIERFDLIAEHICDIYNFPLKNKKSIASKLKKMLDFNFDFKKLYINLFKSQSFNDRFSINITDFELSKLNNKDIISYENSIPFIYLKGLLEGFPYSNQIKQVVIDEAQDYSKIQYLVLKKIFKRASFTILGDINQTINPYYMYSSLESLKSLFENAKYLSLTKSYRSSREIIEYSNKVLGLNYMVSARDYNTNPVNFVNNNDEISILKNEIKESIKKYKKIAIITKSNEETYDIFKKLNNDFKIINILENSKDISEQLIVLPVYLAKGLEFDKVIIYTSKNNRYTNEEKYLYYVAITRSQHELSIYNQKT